MRRDERGAVLLSVLLLVAVMAVVAVGLLDGVRLATLRTTNARDAGQAQWYALGAEAYALALLDRHRDRLDQAPAERPVLLPIDGGSIAGRLVEASNCFNLNSLARPRDADGDGGAEEGKPLPPLLYANLLGALGVFDGEREALVDALADWVDADARPRARGAEDGWYTRLDPPYRPGNTLLTDVAELRAVKGYDAALVARLRPLACALPDTAPAILNLDTLRPDQAALLVMLMGPGLRPEVAERLIADRPPAGWPSLEAFWAHPALAGLNPGERVRALAGLTPRLYRLDLAVSLGTARTDMTSLLGLGPGGTPVVLSRHFGGGD